MWTSPEQSIPPRTARPTRTARRGSVRASESGSVAAERLLADPARIAVRGRHPRPAVPALADLERVAAERLGHLLGVVAGLARIEATSTRAPHLAASRRLEPLLHRRPVVVGDRVPGRVARPGREHHVLAGDPLEPGAEREQRPARLLVPGVRLELDPLDPAVLEGVLEQEQLRLDVRARAPRRAAEPRPADLDPPVLGRVSPGSASSPPAHREADRERHVGRGQRLVELAVEIARPRHEAEDLEAVLGGGAQPFAVALLERLDADDPPGERPVGSDHSGQSTRTS